MGLSTWLGLTTATYRVYHTQLEHNRKDTDREISVRLPSVFSLLRGIHLNALLSPATQSTITCVMPPHRESHQRFCTHPWFLPWGNVTSPRHPLLQHISLFQVPRHNRAFGKITLCKQSRHSGSPLSQKMSQAQNFQMPAKGQSCKQTLLKKASGLLCHLFCPSFTSCE